MEEQISWAQAQIARLLAGGEGKIVKRGQRGVFGEIQQWLTIEWLRDGYGKTSLGNELQIAFGQSDALQSPEVQAALAAQWRGSPVIDESGPAAARYCRQVRW